MAPSEEQTTTAPEAVETPPTRESKTAASEPAPTASPATDGAEAGPAAGDGAKTTRKKRRRRSKKTAAKDAPTEAKEGDDAASEPKAAADSAEAESDAEGEAPAPTRKKRTRRKRGEGKGEGRSGGRSGESARGSSGRGASAKGASRSSEEPIAAEPAGPEVDEIMLVNDAPGDECRIAILAEGHLEELYAERAATATNVGNIYKGRVVNVEPAIQAAFIDYGCGANGFLHISDLHPRYFPGGGATERVGKKIPRRERPAIQEALRRGDEILVQVLKEGLGSKGPTLTSYLSIPGRLLVLMPEMDRVGVSRKVEDDDARREARKALDGIDLPEGFGFILRTAGIGRTKTEIKRDVAYLMRLWKVMDKRKERVGAPCELYTESDLVIRTVRDVMRPSIKAIVVDSESAHRRVSAFLQVIAPRSAPNVIRWRRPTPLFHAFDVERQIEMIHANEVPLPSGGRLVIDQTEALVAIDVNSGRSRSARDSETNAYQTNCEAVDEICRQLRLRDLGGLLVLDLIDMRAMRHRRAIEDRVRLHLKRDRARTTIARISEFGLLEMTRQRMRPSIRKANFVDCPHCAGRGEIKAPESVASEVTRQIGFYLDQPRVARVELVCSPRVASVLLSRKRRHLVVLEDSTGKRIDVRVSDDIAVDRVDYYAYDERSSDIALDRVSPGRPPTVADLHREEALFAARPASDDDDDDDLIELEPESGGGGGRRRRRRRKPQPADATAIALSLGEEFAELDLDLEGEMEELAAAAALAAESDGDTPAASATAEGEGGRKKRRRRRRRRRGGDGAEETAAAATEAASEAVAPEPVVEAPAFDPDAKARIHELAKELGTTSREILERCAAEGIEVKNHMSSVVGEAIATIRGWFAPPPPPPSAKPVAEAHAADSARDGAAGEEGDGEPRRRRRRRRRRRGGEGGAESAPSGDRAPASRDDAPAADPPRVPRSAGQTEPLRTPDRRPAEKPEPPTVESAPAPKRRTLYRNRKPISRETIAEAIDS